MTFKGPFQPKLFCDSMITHFRKNKRAPKNTICMDAVPKGCNRALGSRDEGGRRKMLSYSGGGKGKKKQTKLSFQLKVHSPNLKAVYWLWGSF